MTHDHALNAPTIRILTGMVWLESGRIPMPWHRSLVAYASEHQPRGGAFRSGVAALRKANLVGCQDGRLVIEHGGRLLAEEPGEQFSHAAYRERLCNKLTPRERVIYAQFRDLPTARLQRELLASALGVSASSAFFRNSIAKLLAVGLLEVEGDLYTATEVLWPINVFERREVALAKRSTTSR